MLQGATGGGALERMVWECPSGGWAAPWVGLPTLETGKKAVDAELGGGDLRIFLCCLSWPDVRGDGGKVPGSRELVDQGSV